MGTHFKSVKPQLERRALNIAMLPSLPKKFLGIASSFSVKLSCRLAAMATTPSGCNPFAPTESDVKVVFVVRNPAIDSAGRPVLVKLRWRATLASAACRFRRQCEADAHQSAQAQPVATQCIADVATGSNA